MKKNRRKPGTEVFLYGVICLEAYLVYCFYTRKITYETLLILMVIAFAGSILIFLITGRLAKAISSYRYRRSDLYEIDRMTKSEFIDYLCTRFSDKGYRVKKITKYPKYGADLIVRKNGEAAAVVARIHERVRVYDIQQVISAREYYAADRAIVVTNETFTYPALRLSRKCHVHLIGRKRLKSHTERKREQ